ncbi:DUF899 domain-containing protein [Micromonospora sp. NPDC003197]
MTEIDLPLPPVVNAEAWAEARRVLLLQEKALTRMKDSVAAMRRRLPVVEVTTPYVFEGADGPVSLLDLFGDRPQLIVQHFMFAEDWEEGCDGCSMMADHIGPLSHLQARRTSFALVSRAPIEKLTAFRTRMGWKLPWVSSGGTTFNDDFGATQDGEEQQAISVFIRRRDRIFHSWSTFARGEEPFMLVFDLLDLTPYGRQESWEDSPEGWPQEPTYSWMRLQDRYGAEADQCAHHAATPRSTEGTTLDPL